MIGREKLRKGRSHFKSRVSSSGSQARVALSAMALLTFFVLACQTTAPVSPAPRSEKLWPNPAEAIDIVEEKLALQAEFLRAGDAIPYAERRDRLAEFTRDFIDTPRMARFSYGVGWVDLTAEEQALWIDTFTRLDISSQASLRLRDRGQEYRVKGFRFIREGVLVIRTEIDYPKRNLTVFVDYSLEKEAGGWKIVDRHSPPSVSEIATRRAEYRTILERKGFAILVAEMEEHIRAQETRGEE
jgi:phospholipid transport system substrate-binding protein